MARTSRALLLAVLAAGLLAAASAQSSGKAAVASHINGKIAKAHGAVSNVTKHVDAGAEQVKAHVKSAEEQAKNATTPLLKKIIQGKGAIVGAVVDRAAVVVNGAALKANETIAPINKVATDFMRPLKRSADKLFHAHVKAVTDVVQATADDIESAVKPSADSLGRVLHPVRDAINHQVSARFNATKDAVTRGQELIGNATAPLAPINDAVAKVQSAVVEAGLKHLVGTLDKTARAIDKVSEKFNPLEKTIHDVVDPIDADAKYVRTKLQEAGTNVTKPVKELTYKLVPELRPPRLGQVFSSIFDNLPPPQERNTAADPDRPYDPVLPKVEGPEGKCKPFVVPKPYKHLMDYCNAMKDVPQEYFAKLYNQSAPAKGTPFPFNGCVFGCIVGNDSFTQLQREFSQGFGWSGKCFTKQRDANGVPVRFGSTLNRNFQKMSGYTQKERVSTFKGVGEFVFGGDGAWIEKGLYDGRPSFQYKDDRPRPEMMAAGGWRTLYSMFQAIGDGVTDEFRPLAPGVMIGKSFYSGPQGVMPNKWRRPRDTNFFMLFQACTADGKYAHNPEDRDVPLVGAP